MPRSNNAADHHGRFNMRAQESRFNFTIKGPKLWGAQTTGFIEMDFDGTPDAVCVVVRHLDRPAASRHVPFELAGNRIVDGPVLGHVLQLVD